MNANLNVGVTRLIRRHYLQPLALDLKKLVKRSAIIYVGMVVFSTPIKKHDFLDVYNNLGKK